jgi:hypothetical protein
MNLLYALIVGSTAAGLVFILLASCFVKGFAAKVLRWALRPLALMIVVGWSILMIAAVTQVSLTTQVIGILPIANGGTNSSGLATGVIRSASGALSGAELSGDATTSGSNVVVNTAIHGTTVPTNSSADQFLGTTASATGAWASMPNCAGGTVGLAYATSTHTFSCPSVTASPPTFYQAAPSGTINGSNTSFTLSPSPTAATNVNCFENGVQQQQGAGNDYTISGGTITYLTAPPTGTKLNCQWS